ncbi:hypothetical protein FRB94_002902 [Tulasnella sp. JGI-2019a]|nr:hypothetical protein FRB93_013922 [Tulasnella sp. JGI-2019a]KAG9013374.1 hypothetical protein FRB94_002902 [Tulasnella sp. JGI-2019a]KAG9033720.1 hypothetical protein FRB95_014407 [Tulasnella sp. JGI-2019a]
MMEQPMRRYWMHLHNTFRNLRLQQGVHWSETTVCENEAAGVGWVVTFSFRGQWYTNDGPTVQKQAARDIAAKKVLMAMGIHPSDVPF